MIASFRTHWRLFTIAVFLSLALVSIHYFIETPRGASFDYNLSWFEAFRTAFWQGDLYPRYTSELWYGKGGLDFLFYGPLPFWFTSIMAEITCAGCSTSQAFSVASAWILILSGVSFFLFARRFFPTAWAGFGAIIYVVLPFHYIINWYFGQTIGAITAQALLPLLALSMCQIIEDRKGGPLFAVSIAALALSHLPSMLIIAHFIPVFVICAALTKHRERREQLALLVRFIPWGLLGIALSAFYWVPAIGLLGSVSAEMLHTDYYDPTHWLYLDGVRENDPFRTRNHKSVLISVVACALAAGSLMRARQNGSSLFLWIIVPSAFVAFAMTIVSYPIWKFWILSKIQFPDRTLVVADLALALAAIVVTRHVLSGLWQSTPFRNRLMIYFAGVAFFGAFVLPLNEAGKVLEQGRTAPREYLPVAPLEYIPPTFKQLAYDRFLQRDLDGISNADLFHVFFKEMDRGFQLAEAAFESDAPNARLSAEIHDRYSLQVAPAGAREIRLPIIYWPYWQAFSSTGDSLSVSEDPELGIIRLTVPEGVSEITLELAETGPQKIGSSLSVLALFIFLLAALAPRIRFLTPSEKPLATSLP